MFNVKQLVVGALTLSLLGVPTTPHHAAAQAGTKTYEITVTNPLRRCRGVAAATLDGRAVDPRAIPLCDDGRTHEVQVVLGS